MSARIISTLLIVILGSFALFGFVWIGSMDHGSVFSCPFAMAFGDRCPSVGGSLVFLSHHLSGLQDFFRGIIGFVLLLFLLFLVPAAVISFKIIYGSKELSLLVRELNPTPFQKILFWISLHNKQDSHASKWCMM